MPVAELLVAETIFPMPKRKFIFHDHPLSCKPLLCKPALNIICPLCCSSEPGESEIVYRCTECEFSMHKECIERFLVRHKFMCNHFLKILMSPLPVKANHHCHFCRMEISSLFARCTLCNISVDLSCVRDPPPLTIFQPKHHKHCLTLLLRVVTFTCNACGLEGDRNPYVCLQCNTMLHKDCTDLPRVININRHDHRISHTFHLGEGDWESCGVCRKPIDWVYGAFACSRCPNYAVHSRCATRKEVWDGIELEDVPEEEEEIEEPFKVLNEKDIIHFSHENHILRLDENYVTDKDHICCWGCVLPIYDGPYYKCMECDFGLHKACATLPRKKRHLLHNHKLTLQADKDRPFIFNCQACETYSNGFMYRCEDGCDDNINFDVRCSSISEPFHHDLHPHPLYWTLEGTKQCHACNREICDPLSCTVCQYVLCMKCATLPRKVKHRCDDHFLSLCQGVGNESGDLWCDICETKTDPRVCYYTCDECGVSLHISCVLGDFYYMNEGVSQVFANNGVTRPLCKGCKVRCKFPLYVRITSDETVGYACSLGCL